MNKEIVAVLKPFLRDYLVEEGFHITEGNFSCPIPRCKHRRGDKNPSAGFIPGSGDSLVHCFTSGLTADIFNIFALREGYPLSGPGFYNLTISKLAERFGIEYIPEELTEEQKEVYELIRAYRDAANTISRYPSEHSEKYLLERGWSTRVAQAMMIGSVESFDSYLDRMTSLGWEEDSLRSAGLMDRGIFDPDKLIFTIRAQDGSPCAFVARDMFHDRRPEDHRGEKYKGSATSLIYSKRNILYGYDLARGHSSGSDIWVLEGYPDAISGIEHGLYSVCAIGGTALTQEQVSLLFSSKAKGIVLAFDGDEEGKAATSKAIEKYFSSSTPIPIRVVQLPKDQDPDSLIRKSGLQALLDLPRESVFEWKLKNLGSSGEEVVESAIGWIMAEPDRVRRHYMALSLSDRTGVSFGRIISEIDRREEGEEEAMAAKIEHLKKSLVQRIGREPLEYVLSETLNKIEDIKKDHSKKRDATQYSADIDIIKTRLMEPILGYSFGITSLSDGTTFHNLPLLHRATDGLPRYGCLYTLAGIPGCGKTSFMRYLFYNIAKFNDDVIVIFMSIDDSKSKICQSIVTLSSGIPLNRIGHYTKLTPTEKERWESGFQEVRQMEDRFRIFDSNDGTTTSSLESYIRAARKEFPDRQVLVVLDNFHKLTDFGGSEERTKTIMCSNILQRMTTKYEVPIFMTVELRKMATMRTRPTMNDLKDTVQISYDANVIMLLHNDLQADMDSPIFWESAKTKRPVLEIAVVKNKETGWKGELFYEFDDSKSTFVEIPKEREKEIRDARRGKAGIPSI